MKSINRIKQIIDAKGLTVSNFEHKIDVSNASISTAIKRNSNVKDETLNKILNTFPEIRAEWLLTGCGNMTKEESKIVFSDNDTNYAELSNYAHVPLVHSHAQPGFASGWGQHDYIDELPKIYTQVDKEYKGFYVYFEVSVDSMNDGSYEAILENDVLLCREIQEQHWHTRLHIDQWDFVVVHKTEGVLVKRIIHHDTTNGKLVLHSLNSYYEEHTVFIEDLIAIFNIVKLERSRRR